MELQSKAPVSTATNKSGYVSMIDSKVNEAQKFLYAARVHVKGGRDGGRAARNDQVPDLPLSAPGSKLPGTNPEQVFVHIPKGPMVILTLRSM